MRRNRRNIEVLISGARRSFINRRELFSQKSNTTTESRKTRARVQKGANKKKETNASEKTVMTMSTMDCGNWPESEN